MLLTGMENSPFIFFLNEFSQAVPVQQIQERKGSSAPWPDHGKNFCSPTEEGRVQPSPWQ